MGPLHWQTFAGGSHTAGPGPRPKTGTTEDRRPQRQDPVDSSGVPLDGPSALTRRDVDHASHRAHRGLDGALPSSAHSPLPAVGGPHHRHRAPTRCSGREEARILPVVQTAPSGRPSTRSLRVTVTRSHRRARRRARRAGGTRRRPERPASRSSSSSDPSGSSTAQLPRQRAGVRHSSPARTARPSPRSTARTPRGPGSRRAAQGANLLIYLGHGNGYPSPYGAFQRYTQGRDGPERHARATATTTSSTGASTTSTATSRLAQNAVVILNRLCYASGNSEWGSANPTQVDRHQARRQLRCRLPAGRREGRLRRGDQRASRPRSGRCSPRTGRWTRSSCPSPSASGHATSGSPRARTTGRRPTWIRPRPASTGDPSSATLA